MCKNDSWQGGLGKERVGQAHHGSIKLFLGVVKFIIGWRIKECEKYEREREKKKNVERGAESVDRKTLDGRLIF
jgi:hypothetical protein